MKLLEVFLKAKIRKWKIFSSLAFPLPFFLSLTFSFLPCFLKHFFILSLIRFATFKCTLKCENSDVMEIGPWCWQQYFSHSGEHVCDHKLVFGSIICSNNTVIYKVPLSKQNLECADHTNYKHIQRCRVKIPRPLVLKTDFWKHKSPLTCFSNCIFLEATTPSSPSAHLDFLTLTWSHKSSSFAGNSINCGCWNVLDLNIRAPSVISQKACYKHWMAVWGLSLQCFLNLQPPTFI